MKAITDAWVALEDEEEDDEGGEGEALMHTLFGEEEEEEETDVDSDGEAAEDIFELF